MRRRNDDKGGGKRRNGRKEIKEMQKIKEKKGVFWI